MLRTEVIICDTRQLQFRINNFLDLHPNIEDVKVSIANDGYKETIVACILYKEP